MNESRARRPPKINCGHSWVLWFGASEKITWNQQMMICLVTPVRFREDDLENVGKTSPVRSSINLTGHPTYSCSTSTRMGGSWMVVSVMSGELKLTQAMPTKTTCLGCFLTVCEPGQPLDVVYKISKYK